MMRLSKRAILVISMVVLVGACEDKSNVITKSMDTRTIEQRMGAKYTEVPKSSFKAPQIEQISFPIRDNVDAIWGATGRDDTGNIYFGTSSHGADIPNSYLYQYNPLTNKVDAMGDVISQLKRADLYRPSMGQNKMHSKFYQADDGYVYFSSFDEEGESEGQNSKWGGHLWRKLPSEVNWEHIMATKEALIAINTDGRYVYALGYWGHVLYQYDTVTEKINREVVGSIAKHISRNFVVDENGHAFVPHVYIDDFNEVKVYLNEYDTSLKLVDSYFLPSYKADKINTHHGIVGYSSLKNGDILFTTSDGGFYQLHKNKTGEDKLTHKGHLHPDKANYVASLFSVDGFQFVTGIGRTKKVYEWIWYELTMDVAQSFVLDVDRFDTLLLYGSLTRDNSGAFYVAGRYRNSLTGNLEPLLLKLYY